MKISFLYNKIHWFGKYSGYECLIDYLPSNTKSYLFNASASTLIKKLLGKIYQYKFKIFNQTTFGLASACQFLYHDKADVKHILYLENHLHLLKIASKKELQYIIGTIHLPLSQWSATQLSQLKNLEQGIILYEKEMDSFKSYMPDANLKFIRHGVDNDFFKPNLQLKKNYHQILCVGHYLRDFETLAQVFKIIKRKNNDAELHLIIPQQHRNNQVMEKITVLENVFFHENLSDLELLNFYQTSGFMLMPMLDSGANTAIVQSIACGLPIVTTNNGGIHSYGGQTIFPVFKPDAIDEMASFSLNLMKDISLNKTYSEKIRQFSLDKLDWKIIAKEHFEFYKTLN